jgi:protein-disulfide isomerase
MALARPLAAAFAALAALAVAGGAASAQSMPTPADKEAFGKAVREYLLENPEVLLEAMEGLKEKQQKAETAAFSKALVERRNRVFEDPEAPVAGNPKGDVTLVEFFDYRCPVCKQSFPIVTELVRTDKNIRVVYKDWPILGPDSVYAARAALAARYQGKYEPYHDAMMAARTVNEATVIDIARRVGLDVDRLKRDMDRPEIERALRANHELAEALTINGTPSYIVGNALIRGARDLDFMRKAVADARAK